MAYTLQQLIVDIYKELGQLETSVATGGTTSTIVDSKQAGEHGDNTWNNGALFLIRDAAGAQAAPEGEMALCTAYDDTTGTFTSAASAWTVAPASGDTFGFANNFYPLHTVIEQINLALQSLGYLPLVDITTLDSAAQQTEYAAAVAWKRTPPYRIDIQTKLNDANDNRWVTVDDWEYVPATAGSTGLIEFKHQLPSGFDLRIWYQDFHPVLASYSDVVYEGWPKDFVIALCVERVLRWQNSRLQGGDDFLLQRWNDAKDELARKDFGAVVWKPKARRRWFTTRRSTSYDPDNIATPS